VALWATQRLLPLVPGGEFARGLADGRKAALELDRRIRADSRFVPFAGRPELDIVVWQIAADSRALSSELAQGIFERCATLNLHLALVQLPEAMFAGASEVVRFGADTDAVRTCMRSVLMKPEHTAWLDAIWDRLSSATTQEIG
jgi:hypothetical protein